MVEKASFFGYFFAGWRKVRIFALVFEPKAQNHGRPIRLSVRTQDFHS